MAFYRKSFIYGVYGLFIVSGATSLAYEVVWTRLLVRVFGATSFAVTTVLASYMAGLALGSFIFGRLIDRTGPAVISQDGDDARKRRVWWRYPVRIYGLLELGIGVCAALLPAAILGLNGFYRVLYPALGSNHYLLNVVRFALSFAVLLVPTTLMGGTLPVLSKYVTGSGLGLARRIGLLYAVNTLGAVLGTVTAGYLLLPGLGISGTTWLCVAFNVVIFGAALALSGRGEDAPGRGAAAVGNAAAIPAAVPAEPAGSRLRERVVLAAFALTGFAALVAEVLWTRVLSLVIGTTVYAFSAMLTTFLLGLGLGSAVFSRIAQTTRRPATVFGALVAAIGAAVFLVSIAFGSLPLLYLELGRSLAWGWGKMMWAQFALCFLAMLLPTFLMGGTFPLVARLYVRDPLKVGGAVGTAYAFNTVGAILGSFAGSFVFLQLLGIEKSLTAVALVYLAVGLVLLMAIAELRAQRRIAAAASVVAVAVAAAVFAPRWDQALMTSAVYRYAQRYSTAAELKKIVRDRAILFYDDGPGATVSVERYRENISLVIDGKADASTDADDMITQTMLAHLPLLFHPRPETVLVIGLGCGVSLGSAERYPVREIDCVEILDNVVRASRYFDDYNHRCLADRRVNLILADARNHIQITDRMYDVIISEPTNPWIAGVGDLFTLEFFEMAGRKLKPDGIICAWFHTYQMGDDDLRAMARTFLRVFPEASIWMLNDSDVIFLGSRRPLAFTGELVERLARPEVRADLRRIWVDDVSDILSGYIWGKEGLARYGAQGELHTDDNMMLEYSAARKVFNTTSTVNLATFANSLEAPPVEGMASEITDRVRLQQKARGTALRGTLELLAGDSAEGLTLRDAAYALAPGDPYVLSAYVDGHLGLAASYFEQGDYDRAAENYLRATVEPDYRRSWEGYQGLAWCCLRRGDHAGARKFYELSLERNPYNGANAYNLAGLYMLGGDAGSAASLLEATLRLAPGDPDASNGLARVYTATNRSLDRALDLAQTAAKTDEAGYHVTLGWVLYTRGDSRGAAKALGNALKLDPVNTEALYRLGLLEVASADRDRARRTLERLVGLGRGDEYSVKGKELLRELQGGRSQ